MTDPLLPPVDGATPLHPDDREGLRPSYIATRGELNDAEQRNIAAARVRWMRRPPEPSRLLDDAALRRLHADMLGDVWTWAGQYRLRDVSVGIDPIRIAVAVRNLVADAAEWLATGRDVDEAAVDFHHQLVAIHPFVNGNGRHGRLATDLLLVGVGTDPFTWGSDDLELAGSARERYTAALQAADRGDLGPLFAFVRT